MKQQFIDAYHRMTPERWGLIVEHKHLIPSLAKKWNIDPGLVFDSFVLAASKSDDRVRNFVHFAKYYTRLIAFGEYQNRNAYKRTIIGYLQAKEYFNQPVKYDTGHLTELCQALDEEAREIIRLKFWDGIPQKDIGKRFSIAKEKLGEMLPEIYTDLRKELAQPRLCSLMVSRKHRQIITFTEVKANRSFQVRFYDFNDTHATFAVIDPIGIVRRPHRRFRQPTLRCKGIFVHRVRIRNRLSLEGVGPIDIKLAKIGATRIHLWIRASIDDYRISRDDFNPTLPDSVNLLPNLKHR